MNLKLIQLLESPNFKIDLLYPNYKILSKLDSISTSPIHINSPLDF